jgi:hypothetical protein
MTPPAPWRDVRPLAELLAKIRDEGLADWSDPEAVAETLAARGVGIQEDSPVVAAYLAMEAALAKRILADWNAQREHPRDWPCGQTWDQLGQTSHETFWSAARKEAGLPTESAFKNDVILGGGAPASAAAGPPEQAGAAESGGPAIRATGAEQVGVSSPTEGKPPAASSHPAPCCAACPVREALDRIRRDIIEPPGRSLPRCRWCYVVSQAGYIEHMEWCPSAIAEDALAVPCPGAPEPSEAVAHWAGITVGCAAIPSEAGRETWDALTVAAARFILQFVRDAGAPGGGPQEAR